MRGNEEKNLFNMSGDEIDDWLRNLSTYVLVVELVAVGACLPILTREKYIILTATGILMCFDILAMHFCNERKSRFWIVIRRIQFVIAAVDALSIIISNITGKDLLPLIATYVSLGGLWVHSGLCFFEYRKDEVFPILRHVGAFTVIVTVLICFMIKKWMMQQGITFG